MYKTHSFRVVWSEKYVWSILYHTGQFIFLFSFILVLVLFCQGLFSHDSKVRNLNFNLKCAFWIKIRKTVVWTVCMPKSHRMRNLKCAIQMMIRMTVFWTVCKPNHIAIHNLKCAIQMMVRSPDHHLNCAHFGVHTVQTTVYRILIQNAQHFAVVWKQSRTAQSLFTVTPLLTWQHQSLTLFLFLFFSWTERYTVWTLFQVISFKARWPMNEIYLESGQ